jgi:GMP synthase (glutamine-hydrolysing)
MIYVIDFGGQTAHLISRRLRDLHVSTQFVLPEEAIALIEKKKPQGIILSGGPMSVYEEGAPTIDKKIFNLGIPILGICYGFHLIAYLLGGKVIAGRKEYGPAQFTILKSTKLLSGVIKESIVWMNHGDEIVKLPDDFSVYGLTKHVPYTCAISEKRKLYGILFHPEVEHTQYGTQILKNFMDICDVTMAKKIQNPENIIVSIRKIVGKRHVIGAVSGGVDSTVAAALVAKAIGDRFTPVFVNNGLMRPDAVESVKKLTEQFSLHTVIASVEDEMLIKLEKITDPEEKRKIIGNFYIEVFEREMRKLLQKDHDVAFLLQGTIYSDVIESQGTKYASKIKSHHNVGGLPKFMKLMLLEPLRELYKDEVKSLGRELGLTDEFIMKQPFPGPGYAVRIRGEVTKMRLEREKQADTIVLEELEKAKLLKKVFLSFPIMTGIFSTAVKGDGKFFGEVIALRIVESSDIMTATWAKIPYDILQNISSRIVNEVPGISRVVYDISTKPPATMEWE